MKELGRLLSTVNDPCSRYRFDWERFYSLCRVLQYHPKRVLVTNFWCPPALPCSAWHRPLCPGGTSTVGWGTDLKYFQVFWNSFLSQSGPEETQNLAKVLFRHCQSPVPNVDLQLWAAPSQKPGDHLELAISDKRAGLLSYSHKLLGM